MYEETGDGGTPAPFGSMASASARPVTLDRAEWEMVRDCACETEKDIEMVNQLRTRGSFLASEIPGLTVTDIMLFNDALQQEQLGLRLERDSLPAGEFGLGRYRLRYVS